MDIISNPLSAGIKGVDINTGVLPLDMNELVVLLATSHAIFLHKVSKMSSKIA